MAASSDRAVPGPWPVLCEPDSSNILPATVPTSIRASLSSRRWRNPWTGNSRGAYPRNPSPSEASLRLASHCLRVISGNWHRACGCDGPPPIGPWDHPHGAVPKGAAFFCWRRIGSRCVGEKMTRRVIPGGRSASGGYGRYSGVPIRLSLSPTRVTRTAGNGGLL